jgi:hypothetical protein
MGREFQLQEQQLRMSAIPVIEPIIEQAPSVRTPSRRPAPVVIELPRTRVPRQQVARIQTRKRTSNLVSTSACFVAVSAITFCSLSLVGQVMVEKARRDGIRASARARAAANQVAELRGNIQALVSAGGIEAWAIEQGFIPVDALPVAKAVPPHGTITY